MGPGWPKAFSVGVTLFIQSVWDYPPRNPSGPEKQRHGLQLIAQLHSLPTLSKINSHHASSLFPSSPLRRQLPNEPPASKRNPRCPKPADPTSHGLPGPHCQGFGLIPHTKITGCDFKTQHTFSFVHVQMLEGFFYYYYFSLCSWMPLLVLIHGEGDEGTHTTP